MDDVDCAAGEERLEDCSHRGWGVHNCDHEDDVGVACRPGKVSSEPELYNYTIITFLPL